MVLLTKAVAMQGTVLLYCYLKVGTAVGFHNARLSGLIVASVSWIIYSRFFLIQGLKNSRRTLSGFSKSSGKLIKRILSIFRSYIIKTSTTNEAI